MITGKKILVVDDDAEVIRMLKNFLTLKSLDVIGAQSAKEAQKLLDSSVDLILLDVNMPEQNGYEFCKAIRQTTEIPILFISALDREEDSIRGLMLGGDDYIVKPFSLEALYARIHTNLQRGMRGPNRPKEKLFIDIGKRAFFLEGQKLALTKTEFDILALLAENPQMVFSKERIYEALWGLDAIGDAMVVAEHIRNIRNKCLAYGAIQPIETVWGVGYRWHG